MKMLQILPLTFKYKHIQGFIYAYIYIYNRDNMYAYMYNQLYLFNFSGLMVNASNKYVN